MQKAFLIEESLKQAAMTLISNSDPRSPENKQASSEIVQVFKELTQEEREQLSRVLSSISSVLIQEIKFQPVLFQSRIAIPVSSEDEAKQVLEKLFMFDCGFHNGRYPLTKHMGSAGELTEILGIHVSRTGAISLSFDSDRSWFAQLTDPRVAAHNVLTAQSVEEIINNLSF